MEFEIKFLSFFVIETENKEQPTAKHYQTLDTAEYEESALKDFLDGEFKKIVKRKVERHPNSDQVPTKLGRFILEPGHALDSNPNYNAFNRTRYAESKDEFQSCSEEFVHSYLDTSSVRGGVFLLASAVPRKFFEHRFLFIMKCDFEPKVASISDEKTLIRNVEMAITTKNMKSILYPHMPEEGMIEESELKIHQSSHARYFEDFLKFVEYGESKQEIMKHHVMEMVQEHIGEVYEPESEERRQFEEAIEIWADSPKRELQEKLSTEQVVEAAAQLVEREPEVELKMKLDSTSIKGLLADFGETIHLAKINNRYVLLIEADTILFEKGFSPIEFHKPDDLHQVIEKINKKTYEANTF